MKSTDLQLEQHYKAVANRGPLNKHDKTVTSFNRDIFWYDRDELSRQADHAEATDLGVANYEDHRKAVETAVNMLRKDTVHDIAMCILTHRFFKDYRAKVFAGEGSFHTDYAFLVIKADMIFNHKTGQINRVSTLSALQRFEEPTLVQINHITGDVSSVTVPGDKFTLNEWAISFNTGAPESTSYRVAGMKVA